MVKPSSLENKRVLVTGNTGFKGSWLSLTLESQGAEVFGVANGFPAFSTLYQAAYRELKERQFFVDVRDTAQMTRVLEIVKPDLIFHLAAQSVVSLSYDDPSKTFTTNAFGTMSVLEAMRTTGFEGSAVIVTSDKCYSNTDQSEGYKETDRLGGVDPYSASKAAAEIIFSSYYESFFKDSSARVATARAGNVIGGGDRSPDRLMVDVVESMSEGKPLKIRMPAATRPWQHVLEPVFGYIHLALSLENDRDRVISGNAFNFGPRYEDAKPVEYIVDTARDYLSRRNLDLIIDSSEATPEFKESNLLALDTSKANAVLGWKQSLFLEKAVHMTLEWELENLAGENPRDISLAQVRTFLDDKE